MTESDNTITSPVLREVILEGGPAGLPTEARVRRVPGDCPTVKIPYLGGYEHFERPPEVPADDGREPVVFRWTMRTRIAE